MSADQCREELARLSEAVKAAREEAKAAKAQVAECKAAAKEAGSPEEKAAAKEQLATLDASCRAAKAKAEEAAAREAEFRARITAADKAAKTDPFRVLAEKYAEAYPACETFHITSDKQVFLDKDRNLALYHQKGLGEGEVRTIKVR